MSLATEDSGGAHAGKADVPITDVRRSPAHRATIGVAAAVPWSWFVLRDLFGPVTDAVAIVVPVLVVGLAAVLGLAVVLGFGRRLGALVVAVSVLVAGAVAVVSPWVPADAGAVTAGTGITVAGANVRVEADAADVLRGLAADVVVVAELSPALDAALAPAYPYRHVEFGAPAVGVYSQLPLRVLSDGDLPGARVEVDGRFVLYGLHVPRPWFTTGGGYQATLAEHRGIVDAVAAGVAAETLPVVMVGDLNSPDRGRDYRALLDNGRLVDAMRDGWALPTSTGQWTPLLLRIDHLLVSRGWCGDAARRVELPGSDHRGVTATVGVCAASP